MTYSSSRPIQASTSPSLVSSGAPTFGSTYVDVFAAPDATISISLAAYDADVSALVLRIESLPDNGTLSQFDGGAALAEGDIVLDGAQYVFEFEYLRCHILHSLFSFSQRRTTRASAYSFSSLPPTSTAGVRGN